MAISRSFLGKLTSLDTSATSLSFGNVTVPSGGGTVIVFLIGSATTTGQWTGATIGGNAATPCGVGTASSPYRAMYALDSVPAGTTAIAATRSGTFSASSDAAALVYFCTGAEPISGETHNGPGFNNATTHTTTLTGLNKSATFFFGFHNNANAGSFNNAISDHSSTTGNGDTGFVGLDAGFLLFTADETNHVETYSHTSSANGACWSINLDEATGPTAVAYSVWSWGAQSITGQIDGTIAAGQWSWGAQDVTASEALAAALLHSSFLWSGQALGYEIEGSIGYAGWSWSPQDVDLLKRRPIYRLDFTVPDFTARPDGRDTLAQQRAKTDTLEDHTDDERNLGI